MRILPFLLGDICCIEETLLSVNCINCVVTENFPTLSYLSIDTALLSNNLPIFSYSSSHFSPYMFIYLLDLKAEQDNNVLKI